MGLLDKLNRIEVELCPIEGPIQDIMKGDINPAKDVVGFLRSVLEEYVCLKFSYLSSFEKKLKWSLEIENENNVEHYHYKNLPIQYAEIFFSCKN